MGGAEGPVQGAGRRAEGGAGTNPLTLLRARAGQKPPVTSFAALAGHPNSPSLRVISKMWVVIGSTSKHNYKDEILRRNRGWGNRGKEEMGRQTEQSTDRQERV